jgi:hypothetical protein
LNWRNLPANGTWDVVLPDFDGVSGDKLLIGLLASPTAGVAGYYSYPSVIKDFKDWLNS